MSIIEAAKIRDTSVVEDGRFRDSWSAGFSCVRARKSGVALGCWLRSPIVCGELTRTTFASFRRNVNEEERKRATMADRVRT